MNRSVFTTLLVFSLLLSGCLGSSSASQQSIAAAYAEASMLAAMEAAEESALALCSLDFESGPEAFAKRVCALSTDLACGLFEVEIRDSWTTLEQAYAAQKLACAPGSSRLLEVGRQYGKNVQFWRVNLKGVQGFSDSNIDQVFWLQVVEENGKWLFNRTLSQGEIALYLAIEQME
jgi:hypothetical protein